MRRAAYHRFYTDDGFSGVTFERPGVQQLISDVNSGIVGTVIVKDMSRRRSREQTVNQTTEKPKRREEEI